MVGTKPPSNQGGYMAEQGDVLIENPIINSPFREPDKQFAFDDNGITKCSIEQAHKDGKTSLKKPLSCHLYPIRVTSYKAYDALNVDHWKVCEPACSLGREFNVPVFRFLKDSLIRAYGTEWYEEAEQVHEALEQERSRA